MNGKTRRRAKTGEGVGCSKGVDYLRRNGVPSPLSSLAGRRIGAPEAICIYLRVPDNTPPFHGSSWDEIRIVTVVSHFASVRSCSFLPAILCRDRLPGVRVETPLFSGWNPSAGWGVTVHRTTVATLRQVARRYTVAHSEYGIGQCKVSGFRVRRAPLK